MNEWKRAFAAGVLCAASLSAGGAPSPGPISLPGCTAPPELAASLVEPSALGRRCGADEVCWRLGLAQARALRDRHPSEYDAHRVYVLTARAAARTLGPEEAAGVRAEYEALAAAHPDHPAYPHLIGQLALEGDAYAARLEELAERFPDYPWAHLSLALRARPDSPAEVRDAAGRALGRFVAICPERALEAGRAFEAIGDREVWNALGPAVRQRATERGDLTALLPLWQLARRFAAEDELPAVRSGIVAELDRLTTVAMPDDVAALAALAETAEALGADAALDRAVDRLLDRHPCTTQARRFRSQRYWNRFPEVATAGDEGVVASPAARAIFEGLLAACPGDPWALARKVEGMRWGPAEWTPAVLAAAEALAASAENSSTLSPTPELWLAELYLDRGARIERVPGLLAGALAPVSGAAADADAALRRRTALRLAARHALATAEPAAARAYLAELEAAMESAGSDGSASAGGGAATPAERERRWLDRVRAAVAVAEGRPEPALERLAPWLAELPETSALEAEARSAWIAARGTEAGYSDWRRAISRLAGPATPWLRVDEPRPEVGWTDLSGAALDFGALVGRTVVLRFWASWCPSCRAELPLLARLAERLASRQDIVLLLVDVDREPGALIPYLASGAVTWDPVLGGHDQFGHGLDRVPAAWILDRRGRIVRRQEGAVGDEAGWLEAAVREIESVAAALPAETR